MLRTRNRTSGEYVTPPQVVEKPQDFADTTFLSYSEKIADNITYILKKNVISQLNNPLNIKYREIRIVSSLEFFNGPLTPNHIVDILRYDPATVTRSVKILIENGLLTKIENKRDTRSVLLTLTDEGRALAQDYRNKIRDSFKAYEQHLMSGFTDEEKLNFLSIFVKVSKRSEALKNISKSMNL